MIASKSISYVNFLVNIDTNQLFGSKRHANPRRLVIRSIAETGKDLIAANTRPQLEIITKKCDKETSFSPKQFGAEIKKM